MLYYLVDYDYSNIGSFSLAHYSNRFVSRAHLHPVYVANEFKKGGCSMRCANTGPMHVFEQSNWRHSAS